MKKYSLSIDRLIAVILFVGSIFVGLDIRLNISNNHDLWTLPLIHDIIWPLGWVIVVFWALASFETLNKRYLKIGWAVSAVWHFGWLTYLILTIFGFIGLLGLAPILLFWLLFSGVASLAAGLKIREAEREEFA